MVIIVQRVSRIFAAENRTITSADMAGSRYVRIASESVQAATAFMRATGWEPLHWQARVMARAFEDFAELFQGDSQPVLDKRTSALAAKAAQGKGPPSSIGWRGRARNIKFRSQS